MNTYKITLIALLASLAVVGRYAFAFLPNVQPVTAIIIIAGFWLGPLFAVILALLTTFLSNVFLGMGIWTVWQVIAWAVIGLMSGLIGRYWSNIPLLFLSAFGAFSGLFYGFVLSVTMYKYSGSFLAYYLAGLPFDIYHAAGNAIFIVLLSPVLSRLFERYYKQWIPV
ncbi:energy-coupling factor transport system substrate-specific component [Thalassobacillus cyri]|uniref:Energy-coupling factor transport system substrate-specific component n=1 Tax=Thalassobacillus cyri TaxID=571932 RepID=A0A1H4CIN5_9BACI|nr:ECF transporter S component [Thalassobacillus cyri]SEA60198.1 energy-coupling factor transport system substrate-specific component [Thalassobacillus cyri]